MRRHGGATTTGAGSGALPSLFGLAGRRRGRQHRQPRIAGWSRGAVLQSSGAVGTLPCQNPFVVPAFFAFFANLMQNPAGLGLPVAVQKKQQRARLTELCWRPQQTWLTLTCFHPSASTYAGAFGNAGPEQGQQNIIWQNSTEKMFQKLAQDGGILPFQQNERLMGRGNVSGCFKSKN